MLRFEAGSEPPGTENFRNAFDFWPVQQMLEQTEYDVLEADGNLRFLENGRESLKVEIEYINRTGATVEFRLDGTARNSDKVDFDPASADFDERDHFWELMTSYSLAMEKDRGMSQGKVFSSWNNVENMKERILPFYEEEVIGELERFGWYKVEPDEHVGPLRGADIIRELGNLITRLNNRGAVDYELELLENQQAAAIKSGGYKFLTKIHEDAPYDDPMGAIEFRYRDS